MVLQNKPKYISIQPTVGDIQLWKLHLHHQDSRSLYMNAHKKEKHGLITELWDYI